MSLAKDCFVAVTPGIMEAPVGPDKVVQEKRGLVVLTMIVVPGLFILGRVLWEGGCFVAVTSWA